jgi:hypothetical protein
MKSPEAVLRSALIASASVSAVVGSRIFPLAASHSDPLPYIIWKRTGITREHSLAGPIGTPTVSLEMLLVAVTYEQVRELADKVRLVLDGYGGSLNNVEVKHVYLEQEADDFIQLAGGDLPPVYTVTQTYNIIWQEI